MVFLEVCWDIISLCLATCEIQEKNGKYKKIYYIVSKTKSHYAHCALVVHARYVFPLCAFIVRFRCACCELCVKLLCTRCAHSLRAAVVHNVNPDLLRNAAAQCKTVVRSAWHNGLARVSGAIPVWHNGFGIVRLFC